MGSAGEILMAPITGAMGIGGKLFGGQDELPTPTPLPAPVEAQDVSGQRQYTLARQAQRKGRKSTILGGNKLGGNSTQKRTMLG